jgi:hypothetical protein
MFQELSHVLVLAVAKANAAVANAWRSATANQAGSYRPEAHYMRGPGPKWRAKHPQVSARGDLRPIA